MKRSCFTTLGMLGQDQHADYRFSNVNASSRLPQCPAATASTSLGSAWPRMPRNRSAVDQSGPELLRRKTDAFYGHRHGKTGQADGFLRPDCARLRDADHDPWNGDGNGHNGIPRTCQGEAVRRVENLGRRPSLRVVVQVLRDVLMKSAQVSQRGCKRMSDARRTRSKKRTAHCGGF